MSRSPHEEESTAIPKPVDSSSREGPGGEGTNRSSPPGPTYDGPLRGTILLVEDDYSMGTLVQDYLLHEDYKVVWVRNGSEALAEMRRRPLSLVLLDIGLPDVDGFDVCRQIKGFSDAPIIMLTARGEEADRVAGLEIGADDYVAKPFSPRELMARVKAVLRRVCALAEVATIRMGDVEVDLRAREVVVGGLQVRLTRRSSTCWCTCSRTPAWSSPVTNCWNTPGTSTTPTGRGRWTSTSPSCAASSAGPISSRRSTASATRRREHRLRAVAASH